MIRGLYTAATGLNAEILEQDVVANNIANANTVGFKKDTPILEAFPSVLVSRIHDRMDKPQGPVPAIVQNFAQPLPLGFMGQGVRAAETAVQFTPGSLVRTNQPLDIALGGMGLFTVQRPDGGIAYTRSGNFTVNADKELCTLDGNLVMGQKLQPIVLSPRTLGQVTDQNVVVDTGGGITVDGEFVGNLRLALYDPTRYAKVGDNLYVRHEDAIEALDKLDSGPTPGVQVLQGYIEQSNVKVVTEMVHMISLMRAYEENTKVITMQDQTLAELTSEVGIPA